MNSPFSDAQHGQRGGGSLHALATDFAAGFLAPSGHRVLAQIAQTLPRLYRSPWFNVTANNLYQMPHQLGRMPDIVQVWFRPNAVATTAYWVTPLTFGSGLRSGISILATPQHIILRTNHLLWAGETAEGSAEFTEGQYQVRAIAYGQH